MTPAVAEPARVPEALTRAVVEHYERQLRLHGPTARGMDWKDEASQQLRFAVLCEIAPLDGRSVCEVGAGAGHLWDFLQARGIRATYCGIDLSAAMVQAARARHPGVRFERRDVLREEVAETWDVVLCSGLFHVKLDHAEPAWREFVEETLRRMWAMCRLGIAFNLMSDQVDFRVPTLFYSNPGETLAFCQRALGRFVALRHDYPLHEYTVYVYRTPPRR
jgi:SAM-dependent methyltransferase